MKFKHILPILTLCLGLSLCGCSLEEVTSEDTSASAEITRTVGPSEIYTEEEINLAMDALESYIGSDFSGSIEIVYDESFSLATLKDYDHPNGNEQPLMILTTTFDAEETTTQTEFGEEYSPARDDIDRIWVAEYSAETWWIFDTYYECAPYPFNIRPTEVTEVVVGNGSNGDHKICTKEQAAEIIAMLNEFHCKKKEQREPTSGWTYGIRITNANGETYWLTIRDKATIETETFTVYTAADPDYFADFLETWYET